jgi:hypothetical protein
MYAFEDFEIVHALGTADVVVGVFGALTDLLVVVFSEAVLGVVVDFALLCCASKVTIFFWRAVIVLVAFFCSAFNVDIVLACQVAVAFRFSYNHL